MSVDQAEIVSNLSDPVTFLLNGKNYTRSDPSITVQAMLNLAEVAVANNRIAQLASGEQTLFLKLDHVITLVEGDQFETIPVYVYYVDTEQQISVTDHLKVREILSNAGVDPESHYLIELRGHEQIEFRDLDKTLDLHQDEKFISIYHGPTPVS